MLMLSLVIINTVHMWVNDRRIWSFLSTIPWRNLAQLSSAKGCNSRTLSVSPTLTKHKWWYGCRQKLKCHCHMRPSILLGKQQNRNKASDFFMNSLSLLEQWLSALFWQVIALFEFWSTSFSFEQKRGGSHAIFGIAKIQLVHPGPGHLTLISELS